MHVLVSALLIWQRLTLSYLITYVEQSYFSYKLSSYLLTHLLIHIISKHLYLFIYLASTYPYISSHTLLHLSYSYQQEYPTSPRYTALLSVLLGIFFFFTRITQKFIANVTQGINKLPVPNFSYFAFFRNRIRVYKVQIYVGHRTKGTKKSTWAKLQLTPYSQKYWKFRTRQIISVLGYASRISYHFSSPSNSSLLKT